MFDQAILPARASWEQKMAWSEPMQRTVPLILVVDPDAATLAVCDEVLRSAGYAMIGCQTAREAQRHIHEDRPDLVVVDLHLDWYEAGWDLLCLLRQVKATATLPVIVCSADQQVLRTRQRQLLAWQCQILVKPFTVEQLLTAVQAAIALAPLHSRAVGE
jgi:DNA-binding response OmpR family regulator